MIYGLRTMRNACFFARSGCKEFRRRKLTELLGRCHERGKSAMPATGLERCSDQSGGMRHSRRHAGAPAGSARAAVFTGNRFRRRHGSGGVRCSGDAVRNRRLRGRSETGRHLHPRSRATVGFTATGAELRRRPAGRARSTYAEVFGRPPSGARHVSGRPANRVDGRPRTARRGQARMKNA